MIFAKLTSFPFFFLQQYSLKAQQNDKPPAETVFDVNLLTINDDCILEILNNLDCIDLGSVADLSRLKYTAEKVFLSKWKGAVTLSHDAKQEAYDFLRNLGSQIKSIRLMPNDEHKSKLMHDESIVNLLGEYCSASLGSLEIHRLDFSRTKEIRPMLFSGLQRFILVDCAIPIGMLSMCSDLAELSLIRVEELRNCAPHENLKLNKLKTLKIEMHPKIRCRHRHCNMNATHLDYLGYEIRREVRAPRLHGLEFIDEAQTLEYLEIDVLPQDLIASILESVPKFKNLKILKIYCEYMEEQQGKLDIIEKLENLTEFVWGYPKIFNAKHLLHAIENGKNLQQLTVIFSNRPSVHERIVRPIDAVFYQQMLDVVLKRSNGKPLNVVIVGHRYESQLKQFDATFPLHESLKITCLRTEVIGPILNVNVKSTYGRIKMSEAQVKLLRDREILP